MGANSLHIIRILVEKEVQTARDILTLSDARLVERKRVKEGSVSVYTLGALEAFLEGATFLSVGGGGPKQVAFNLLYNSGIQSAAGVSVSSFDTDDFDTALAGEVFAPTAIWKNQDYQACLNSFNRLCPDNAVVYGIELATINGITAPIVAGLLNQDPGRTCYFLLDSPSDRAIPKMNMDLYQGVAPLKEIVMVSKNGTGPDPFYSTSNNAEVAETYIVEQMGRYPDFNGVGGFSTYPLKFGELKRQYRNYLFENGVDYAYNLGLAMKTDNFLENIMALVTEHTGGFEPCILFYGYFDRIITKEGSQDHYHIQFKSASDGVYEMLSIYSSNENLIAYRNGYDGPDYERMVSTSNLTMGPDGFSYLLLEDIPGYDIFNKGESFTNEAFDNNEYPEDLLKDKKVVIIALPEPRLRNHDGLQGIFIDEISLVMKEFPDHESIPQTFQPIEDLIVFQPVIRYNLTKTRNPVENVVGIAEYEIHIETSTKEAAIHYTTDGSVPTPASSRYTYPFLAKGGTKIRARAFKDGLAPSVVMEQRV